MVAIISFLTAAHVVARADQPTDPRRPAAIVTQDVPVVSAELVARLAQYQDVRSASFQGWSPDGKGILIGTRFGNSTQLHRVYQPGGRREQVTFFEEPVGGRFIPKATDGALLVTMSQGGNENNQIYLLDRAAYTTTLLTDGRSRNLLGPVRHDGAKMIVLSNRRNGRDTDVYMAGTRNPPLPLGEGRGEGRGSNARVASPRNADSMQLLLQSDGQFWTATDWSQDGAKLLMNRYVSINETYPALLDVATRSLKPLPIPSEGKAAFGSLAFAPDGRAAYLSTDARGEFQQLARLDLELLKYQWLMDNVPWDVSDIVVDPKSGAVAVTVNEDGASKLFLLEGDKRRELKLPLGIVAEMEFSPDGRSWALRWRGPTRRPTPIRSASTTASSRAGPTARWAA